MATKRKAGVELTPADIKRRYPTAGIADEICITPDRLIWLPSSILALNWQTGGGLPYGRIMESAGEESTGKTLLGIDYACSAQKLGGICLWADSEATFDRYWAERNGMDLTKTILLPNENIIEVVSDWSADMAVTYRKKLGKKVPIILVWDSMAAWETRDNMEAADDDSGEDMGRRSKKIYQLLRKRTKIFAENDICVYSINQLRKKVGASKWEDPDTTPGGSAMKFFASIRSRLYQSKVIKDEKTEEPIGRFINIRHSKSKVAPVRKTIKARVFFQETNGILGYDPYFGFLEILEDAGIIERRRGLFYRKGKLIAKGEENMDKLIREDKDFRSLMIKKLGINTISKTREKL